MAVRETKACSSLSKSKIAISQARGGCCSWRRGTGESCSLNGVPALPAVLGPKPVASLSSRSAARLGLNKDAQTVSVSLSLTRAPWCFACSHCIQQILEAVLHCHQMGVVHRDLKVSGDEGVSGRGSSSGPLHPGVRPRGRWGPAIMCRDRLADSLSDSMTEWLTWLILSICQTDLLVKWINDWFAV